MRLSIEEYASYFTALSEATRLQMLQLIDTAGEMPCTILVEKMGIAKSTVSYHIKILSQAKLVRVRKQGRNYFYTPRRDVMDDVLPGFRESLVGKAGRRKRASGVTPRAV